MTTLNIELTDAAATHIKRLMSAGKASVLNVGVKATGCSGYAYTFSFAEQLDPALATVTVSGLTLQADAVAAGMLRGSTLDLEKKGLSQSLTFKNPNETARCGCGESFQFKP